MARKSYEMIMLEDLMNHEAQAEVEVLVAMTAPIEEQTLVETTQTVEEI